MAVSDFAQELVRVAREQLAEFGGLDEGSDKLSRQIRHYWEDIGLRFPDGPNEGGVEVPWSAVFVSWCMMTAGATREEFKFSSGHWEYVKAAIRNADKGTGVFRAVPIDRAPVEVGDLIHVNRDVREGVPGTTTYDQARTTTTGYSSHCDIVIEVERGVAKVIGGNLHDTRSLDTHDLTSAGFVKQQSRNPYISVVKNLKGATAQEDDVMATTIKIDEPGENQLWLYAGGQRRPFKDPREITELREKKLLDDKETSLSRAVFNNIPIMPGASS